MFIEKQPDGALKAELDRVEIALLFCLIRGVSPEEAIKITERFLSAQK